MEKILESALTLVTSPETKIKSTMVTDSGAIKVYPTSIHKLGESIVMIARDEKSRFLLVVSNHKGVVPRGFVGEEIKGAKRWIEIPGIGSFQPSELTKICIVLFTAYLASRAPKTLNKLMGFVGVLVRVLPLIILVVIENLSTAIVLSGIVVVICFVTSKKKWYFFAAIGVGIVGVIAVFVFGEGFRMGRINAWLNVETHPLGYQTLQGLYSP